jgi:hypothetical protein
VTQYITIVVIILVTPKAAAKHDILFNHRAMCVQQTGRKWHIQPNYIRIAYRGQHRKRMGSHWLLSNEGVSTILF